MTKPIWTSNSWRRLGFAYSYAATTAAVWTMALAFVFGLCSIATEVLGDEEFATFSAKGCAYALVASIILRFFCRHADGILKRVAKPLSRFVETRGDHDER